MRRDKRHRHLTLDVVGQMSLGAILAFAPTVLAILKVIAEMFSGGREAWEDHRKDNEREELRRDVSAGVAGLRGVNELVHRRTQE